MINSIKQFKNVILFYILCIVVVSYISIKISMHTSMWNNNEVIVLLIILGSFNMHKIGTIFDAKKEPKIFWTNRIYLIRYLLIIFFKSFGFQILTAFFCLFVLILFKMITIDYFILSFLYLMIMNFSFSLTKIYLYIFNVISLSFPFFLMAAPSRFFALKEVVLFSIISSMYIVVILYLFFSSKNLSKYKHRFITKPHFRAIRQNQILLEKIVHYRVAIIAVVFINLIIVFIASELHVIKFVSPGSILVILCITIFESLVGNSFDELDLDKYRIKSLLSNTSTSFLGRFRGSSIYIWYFLASLNIILSSIIQVILTKQISAMISIIYIPCLLIISIIYYRKSELIVSRSSVKTKYVIIISYIVVISGGIVLEVYT